MAFKFQKKKKGAPPPHLKKGLTGVAGGPLGYGGVTATQAIRYRNVGPAGSFVWDDKICMYPSVMKRSLIDGPSSSTALL